MESCRCWKLSFVSCCSLLLLASCAFENAETPHDNNNPQKTLQLQQDNAGNLVYCDDNGECASYPNPDNCEILKVEIDTVDGRVCEICEDSAGNVVHDRCADTNIVCTVVSAPEPDCVVCAYQNGSIIFSSCVAEDPYYCVEYVSSGDAWAESPASGGSAGSGAPEAFVAPCWYNSTDPSAPEPGCAIPPNDCTPEECGPALGMPNYICPDGSVGGPQPCERDPSTGVCSYKIRECPAEHCKVCYDRFGNEVIDTCGQDCRAVACPQVLCAPGYQQVVLPGECCPTCIPDNYCENVVCPMDMAIPECPPGSELVISGNDCCKYECKPNDCSMVACPQYFVEPSCPIGYHWDTSWPNCCGTCVPDVDPNQYCLSDDHCAVGQVCYFPPTDACLQPPECQSGDLACPAVCWGICRDPNVICQPFVGDVMYCGGHLKERFDENGCPIAPVCVCDEIGTPANADGTCPDRCALVDCAPPQNALACGAGQHLSTDYPYCCGACICDATGLPPDANGECVSTCFTNEDCAVGYGCYFLEAVVCDPAYASPLACIGYCYPQNTLPPL